MLKHPGPMKLETSSNGIYINTKEAINKKIEYLIKKHSTILFVYSDDFVSSYDLNDLCKLSIYKILKQGSITERCQMPLNKFVSLAEISAFDFNKYEIIVFSLTKIYKIFATVYSFLPIKKKSFFFMQETEKEDPLLLGIPLRKKEKIMLRCKEEEYLKQNKLRIRHRLIIIEPSFCNEIETYYPLKLSLTNEKLIEKVNLLEDISFIAALQFINSIEGNIIIQDDKEIKNTEEIRNLLQKEMKFKTLIKLLQNKEQKFVLVSKNEDLFEILKRFPFSDRIIHYRKHFYRENIVYKGEKGLFDFIDTEFFINDNKRKFLNSFEKKILQENSPEETKEHNFSYENQKNNLILIFYDFIEIKFKEEEFSEVILFQNIKNAFKNFLSLKTNNKAEKLFLKYEKKKGQMTENLSIKILRTIIYLIKKYYDDHFLYLNLLDIEFSYEQLKNGFICTLKLPLLNDDEIFLLPHKSSVQENKRKAQQEVCYQVINKLKNKNFISENYLPTDKFLDKKYLNNLNDIYGLNSNEEVKAFRDSFIEKRCKNFTILPQHAKKEFKTKYSINILKEIDNQVNICYPLCLISYPEVYSVYVYEEGSQDDFDIGICCRRSFTESTTKPKIDFLFEKSFSKEEFLLIFLFSVDFFWITF